MFVAQGTNRHTPNPAIRRAIRQLCEINTRAKETSAPYNGRIRQTKPTSSPGFMVRWCHHIIHTSAGTVRPGWMVLEVLLHVFVGCMPPYATIRHRMPPCPTDEPARWRMVGLWVFPRANECGKAASWPRGMLYISEHGVGCLRREGFLCLPAAEL